VIAPRPWLASRANSRTIPTGFAREDREQDRVVVDGADVQALLGAFVKSTENSLSPSSLASAAVELKAPGGEGGVETVSSVRAAPAEGERLAAAIDQQHGGAARVAEESLQHGVDPPASACGWRWSCRITRLLPEPGRIPGGGPSGDGVERVEDPQPGTATASNAGTRRAPRFERVLEVVDRRTWGDRACCTGRRTEPW